MIRAGGRGPPPVPGGQISASRNVAWLRYHPDPTSISLDDLRVLGLAISALQVDVAENLKSYLRGTTARPDDAFKAQAETLLKRLAHDMRYHYRLVSAVRRSERDYWWPRTIFTTAASRFRQLVSSARWPSKRSLIKPSKIEGAQKSGQSRRTAGQRRQISYNMLPVVTW